MDPSPTVRIAAAIRRERARADLTLTDLAARAGIAKSTLSQLETGTANPSVETLWAIATALSVPFSQLVDPPRTGVRVVRAGDGLTVRSSRASYAAELLSTSPPHARRDLFRIVAEPGGARVSDPHPSGTVEHVVLASGRARVGPADEPVELRPGDFVTYAGDEPHVFEALRTGTTAVLVSELS